MCACMRHYFKKLMWRIRQHFLNDAENCGTLAESWNNWYVFNLFTVGTRWCKIKGAPVYQINLAISYIVVAREAPKGEGGMPQILVSVFVIKTNGRGTVIVLDVAGGPELAPPAIQAAGINLSHM